MRRRANQKKLIPLVLSLLATMVGAALAVPSITVNVQNIGAGGPTKVQVPGGVATANVTWVLATNPDYVKGVKVTFDQDVPSGTTIIVKVYAQGDDPNDPNTAPSIVKQVTLSADLPAGNAQEIDFDSPVAIGSNIDKVAVVLVGP
jgi:hypothetical protein